MDSTPQQVGVRLVLLLGILITSCVEPAQTNTVRSPQASARFRVVTFNVLVGFRGGKTLDQATQWLAEQEPDVVALQELKGYTQQKLEETARRWGHAHAKLCTLKSGLHLGLTSRTPIENAHPITGQGIRLGALHGHTGGIDFFVIHQGHGSDAARLRETDILLEAIRRRRASGGPAIVLGDFNATSRLDSEFYQRNNAETADGRVYRRNDRGFAILNHRVMDQYLNSGWQDVVHQHQGVMTRKQASWPSLVYADNQIFIRIDLILADASLAARCVFARVMKDARTHHLSDHYPVMADFQWP